LTNQNSLEQIVLGCVKTRRESQKELYKLYYGFAMSICVRYCNNEPEAEEIVNDGFLKIFNQVKKFKPACQNYEASLAGWMKRIFLNTAIDNYRKHNKAYGMSLIDDSHFFIADIDKITIDKMSYKEIVALLQNLSPTYRAIFNLHVIDGLKHEEIAELLKISVGTSKSNLVRARQSIQKMLCCFAAVGVTCAK
jgi:RNA polymerase sigma factor (sigma-70 family)